MRRGRALFAKYRVGRILAASLIVLGIGCIAWALASIWMDTVPFGDLTGMPSTPVAVAGTPTKTPVKALYATHPADGVRFGTLWIPALRRKLPIVEGTTASDLSKGVGHYTHSVLPGEDSNCVISGHRDTVFTGLGELKIRDRVTVQTGTGSYTYQITRIRIVHKDDRTVIVPTDHPVLTMTTCYPFHYIGHAPDRYILSADLVATS